MIQQVLRPAGRAGPDLPIPRMALAQALVQGLALGLVQGLSLGLVQGLSLGLVQGLALGLAQGLALGLVQGLALELAAQLLVLGLVQGLALGLAAQLLEDVVMLAGWRGWVAALRQLQRHQERGCSSCICWPQRGAWA